MAGMDDVPREVLQAAYQRKPLYVLKVPFLYGIWFAVGWAIYATRDSRWAIPIGLAGSLMITLLMRGVGAVAHDAVHGTVVKNKTAAYWIGLICWAPTGMAFTIYGNYHLHHHRITNTYPDVDNFVVTDYTKNPTLAKLLTFAVYLFAYPIYFLFQMFRYTKRLSPWKKVRMNLELAGWWGLVFFAAWHLPVQVMFFLYWLPFVLGSMVTSWTSMIEHFEMEEGPDEYSSRTYGTKSYLLNFIWNNVTFHNEHHKFPGIPWYNLRSFHEAAYPYYDDRIKANCFESFLPVVWMLWKKVFQIDVAKIEAKYAHIDRAAEREKRMALSGIEPEGPEPMTAQPANA